MIASLFLKELKAYRTSFLTWAGSIVALIAVTMAAMPTMLANSATIGEFIKAFPAGLMEAFSFDASSLTDPLGFYVVYSTLYVALLGGAFSISVGAGIIAKEETTRSADFLLSEPFSRSEVALTKMAAWLVLVVALNILTFFTGWACLAALSPLPWRFGPLVVVSIYALLLSIAMGAIGLVFSLMVRKARPLTGAGIGIVLGFYLWDAIAKMVRTYEAWGWLSPFKWMDLKVASPDYGLSAWRVGAFVALTLVCAASAVLIYRKKDILT